MNEVSMTLKFSKIQIIEFSDLITRTMFITFYYGFIIIYCQNLMFWIFLNFQITLKF